MNSPLELNKIEEILQKQFEFFEGKVIYCTIVDNLTKPQRTRQDIPLVYAVVDRPDADGGCVVYGYNENRKEWYANPSLRWLVKHLIEENARKEKNGNDAN